MGCSVYKKGIPWLNCRYIMPSFNRMIYLSVDPIFQSLWFLSGFDRRLLPTKKLLNQGLRKIMRLKEGINGWDVLFTNNESHG
jgi:hypothetical protein